MIHTPVLAFHITNQCNLNCTHCQTMSNYNFSGHSLWEDHRDYYIEWSKKISLDYFDILGGEPLLNPTVLDWFTGIADLWPNAKGKITSNGYALSKKNKKFYDILKNSNGKHWLEISHHNPDTIDFLFKKINDWIEGPTTIKYINHRTWPHAEDYLTEDESEKVEIELKNSYQRIRGDDWPDLNSINDWDSLPDWIKEECIHRHHVSPTIITNSNRGWKIVDSNGVIVIVRLAHEFAPGPLIPKEDQSGFNWHQSDPSLAHDVCLQRFCHEFYNGKIHKCATAGHFEEFQKQFNVDLNEVDVAILKNYQPATLDMSEEELTAWFGIITDPIAQCRFCSEGGQCTSIKATTKKIFFPKKIN